ncbi:MAG: HAMP domain-containing sensor histidine kinase [Elusimicrobia bacterium]|nr:HAMP domain-containing sensor histidine kinase [Elusimicrobiota bacterium]
MRLSVRLALVFSCFGLVIAAGLLTHHVRIIRREAYARAENMAQTTATAVRALVGAQARAGRYRELGSDLTALVRQAGMVTVQVRDRRGRALLTRVDDSRMLGRAAHPGLPIDQVPDGVYDVERDVSLGERGRGVVLVGYHMRDLEARLAQIEAQAVQWGVSAFLGIVLTAWLMGAWFGWRIERLVPRVEALPRHPERFRTLRGEDAGDEVGRLIGAFNRMGGVLKEETRRRRELELEKRELSAMLVHDLKTPLTVIRSGVTLLREQSCDYRTGKGCRRTMELLSMSTDRLQRMVEDVLQLARMEEIAGLRESKPVDLGQLAAACAKDFALVSADRKQALKLELPDGIVGAVSGDAALLRRVLDNLVYNAIEHTPAGGVVSIRMGLREGRVRVGISDGGPGVPPEARPELFHKFFQKDLKRHVGNVGLGLAFCLKAVQRHGGDIGVEDAQPRGACFYFTLPLADGKPAAA